MELKEDPALLGGLSVQLGSLKLDATLAGALNSMKSAMTAPGNH
jgi:F0F1-type ATP synthase delta subunit